MTEAPGPGPKDGGLAALVDDSPQKRLLAQKATPPPSPLLSELLKKGNLISASPRLVSQPPLGGHAPNRHIPLKVKTCPGPNRWVRETPPEA